MKKQSSEIPLTNDEFSTYSRFSSVDILMKYPAWITAFVTFVIRESQKNECNPGSILVLFLIDYFKARQVHRSFRIITASIKVRLN